EYYQAEAAVTNGRASLRFGQEVLSGDAARPERRFQTPLASLHLFQGWADKFLVTPAQGLRDTYVLAGYKRKTWEVTAWWHDFRAEAASRRYGRECDVSVAYRSRSKHEWLLKYADYRTRGFASDTRKIWLQYAREFR
ncbi:MAG: hypothetical protein RML32_06710, partial [Gammaproteobacteria bacterium]|nr:hypothetical protein [Gammaproteobacteria bacterium]